MSWTSTDGTAIDAPRPPRCQATDFLRSWAGRDRTRIRACSNWAANRVLGITLADIAKSQRCSLRTVARHIGEIEKALDSFR